MSPRPNSRNARIVAYIAAEPYSTAADVAEEMGMSLVDASSTLRKLYERDLLDRRPGGKRARGADVGQRPGPPVYVYTVRA